jgi:hypothetical protein
MLPMRPGLAARRSHDYKRHGTIALFAALVIATGRVIGKCYGRHRATEHLRCTGVSVSSAEILKIADFKFGVLLDRRQMAWTRSWLRVPWYPPCRVHMRRTFHSSAMNSDSSTAGSYQATFRDIIAPAALAMLGLVHQIFQFGAFA